MPKDSRGGKGGNSVIGIETTKDGAKFKYYFKKSGGKNYMQEGIDGTPVATEGNAGIKQFEKMAKEQGWTVRSISNAEYLKSKETQGIFTNDMPVKVEQIYNKNTRQYENSYLSVSNKGNGTIELYHATGYDTGIKNYDKGWTQTKSDSGKTIFKSYMRAGIEGKNGDYTDSKFFGINFKNVKVVKGKTYPVKNALKELGFKWSPYENGWIK